MIHNGLTLADDSRACRKNSDSFPVSCGDFFRPFPRPCAEPSIVSGVKNSTRNIDDVRGAAGRRSKRRQIAALRAEARHKQRRVRDLLQDIRRIRLADDVADIGRAALGFRPLAKRGYEFEHGPTVSEFLPLEICGTGIGSHR